MKINVKKFDMSKMKKDATVLLIGKRGSGKSTLLKDILFHMRDRLDFGLLFSATEEATNCLDGIIPKSCMYSDYSESAVAVMLQLQKMARKKGNAKNVFIISDDLGFDKKNLSSKVTKECYLNGRHSNLFYITCQQYCLDAPPAIRTNIDYVISFADNVYSNRERLWKNFFGVFASMSDFEAVYRECTRGYDCMIMDNTQKTVANVGDNVYWYAARDNLPSFKMCKPVFWELDRQYYRDRDLSMNATVVGVRGREKKEEAEKNVFVVERQDATGRAISTISTTRKKR